MKKLVSLLVAGAALGAGVQTQATTVTLSSITGTWLNPTPVGSIDGYVSNGTTNSKIAWGGHAATTVGTTGGDSGYGFQAAASTNVNVPPSPASFTLGTFTHYNQPISGSSITGVDLKVTTDIKIGAVDEGLHSFLFHFTHTETDNSTNPCADGGQDYASGTVDANGCADHVVVSNTTSSDSFLIDGNFYTINILGFQQSSGVTNDFWTMESANDVASLVANVTLARTVPEPSSFALVGLAIGAIGFVGRKKR